MRIWNHDGGEVESCGNASRCVVALTGADEHRDRRRHRQRSGRRQRSRGGDWRTALRLGGRAARLCDGHRRDLPLAWGELAQPMALNVGNPHLVFFVEDAQMHSVGRARAADRARPGLSRTHQRQRRADRPGRHPAAHLGARRGSHAAPAAPAPAPRRSRRSRPSARQSPVKVTMPGGSLTIAWAPGEPIRMRGAATYVYQGRDRPRGAGVSVETITLGCRLNFAESETMRAARCRAARIGSSSTAARSPVRRCARPGRRSAARAAIDRTRKSSSTGCAVQLEPERFRAMPEVDRIEESRLHRRR